MIHRGAGTGGDSDLRLDALESLKSRGSFLPVNSLKCRGNYTM